MHETVQTICKCISAIIVALILGYSFQKSANYLSQSINNFSWEIKEGLTQSFCTPFTIYIEPQKE